MTDRPLTVAFDLDGTLIDSVRDLGQSACELVTSLGGRPITIEDVGGMVGEGAAVLVRRALAAAGLDPATPDALPRFLEIYDRRLLETTVAYPGTIAMLTTVARAARLCVLTNKPFAPSKRILDALALTAFFDEIVGGDNRFGRKPDPAALRALTPGSIVLVGDSPIDWETTRAAGCAFVWARYGFGAARFPSPPETPYVIDRPADLPALVDRLQAIRF